MTKSRPVTSLVLLIALFCCQHAAATSVLPISLQRMTAVADIVFHGKAVSNETRLDPVSKNIATFTRFEVIEVVKGTPGRTHTIKQIGGQIPGSNSRLIIYGVPQFTTGEEYVVFLPKASSLGFSSPLGLSQGKFDIRNSGEQALVHGASLGARSAEAAQRPLAETPSAVVIEQAQPQAGVPLANFLQDLRTMLAE